MDENDGVDTLASEGTIAFAGNLTNKLVSFAFVVVATRVVTSAEFGIFTLGLSFISFVHVVCGLSLNRSLDYIVPQYLEQGNRDEAAAVFFQVVNTGLVLAIVAAVFVFVGRGWVAELLSTPRLTDALAVLAWAIPFVILRRTFIDWFAGLKRLDYRMVVRDVGMPVVKLAAAGILLMAGFRLVALTTAYLLAMIAGCVLGAFIILRQMPWVKRGVSSVVPSREIVEYSAPLAFASVIYLLISQIDYFIISYIRDSSAVGEYRIAFVLAANLLIFLRAFTPIFKPLVSESKADDSQNLGVWFKTAARWSLLFTIPPAITLLAAPETYLTVLFTGTYSVAAGALIILIMGFLFNASFGPDGMMLEGLGKTRLNLYNSIFYLSLNIILDFVLVPEFGILGAALGTAGAMTMVGALTLVEIYVVAGIHPFSMKSVQTVIAGTMTGAVAYGFTTVVQDSIATVLSLPVLTVSTFLITHHFIVGYTEQDLSIARKLDSRLGTTFLERIVASRR